MQQPIKILYILGSGHSGSTLTDLILGSHSEVESAGEIEKYWKLSSDVFLSSNKIRRMCTCGKFIDDCDYWRSIAARLNLQLDDPEQKTESSKEFEIKNYALIKAILKVSEKKIFCDSSKSTLRLEKLLGSERFNVQIIHLVRDPRAVAYSTKRKGIKTKNTQNYNFFDELKDWKSKNSYCFARFGRLENYHLLKYEELVTNPERTIYRLMKSLDMRFEPQQLSYGNSNHHNICGNRMRLSKIKKIVKDSEYLTKISFREWWFSTIYTIGMLKKLNYPIIRKQN